MSDITSLAAAIYPDLPTAAEDAAGVPEGAAPRSRASQNSGSAASREGGSIASKMYPDLASEAAPEHADARGEEVPDDGDLAEAGGEFGTDRQHHLVDQFHDLAREAGLSPARSEAMLKLHEKALADTSVRYWNEQGAAWEKQSRRQFGSRLNSMVGAVQPLLNDPRLTPPAFRNLLDQYRIGSHPVVIDTLSRWAAAMQRRR